MWNETLLSPNQVRVRATLPACSVELTVFFPAFGPSAFFQFIEYSRALTALILPSIPLVILTSLLTAHTAETPSKHVRTYGKHGFLDWNWQSLPANKGTREQSGAFMKVTPATPRRSQSLINGPLKHSGSLMCSVKNINVALPVMTLSVSKWDQPPGTTPVWARTQQYLTISGALVWDRMDNFNFHRWL